MRNAADLGVSVKHKPKVALKRRCGVGDHRSLGREDDADLVEVAGVVGSDEHGHAPPKPESRLPTRRRGPVDTATVYPIEVKLWGLVSASARPHRSVGCSDCS
jgi:hypothetical protein